MKITRFQPADLKISVIALRRGCQEVNELNLVQALRAFNPAASPATHHEAPISPGKALSPAQAAARLGVSRGQIFRLLKAKRLPRVKLGARTVRIPEAALVAMLAEGGAGQ